MFDCTPNCAQGAKTVAQNSTTLEHIRLGNYGYCEESGEPIGIPRLLIRPTAVYCIEEKSVQEIKEHRYRD